MNVKDAPITVELNFDKATNGDVRFSGGRRSRADHDGLRQKARFDKPPARIVLTIAAAPEGQ
jgi:hypothetical protein